MDKYLVIEGNPRPKQRPRIVNGHAYTPQETKDYEAMIGEAWLWQAREMAQRGEPIEITITFFMSIPKSWNTEKKVKAEQGEIRPTTKPDIDNLAKAICDGLNGIAYEDDNQIVEMHLSEYYSIKPRIEIHIRSG